MKAFIGRKIELEKLNDLSRQKRAVLVVIKGRRCIDKGGFTAKLGKI